MGAGDWNDGLSAIGLKLKSESVWLAHFLVGILEDWAELEERLPRPDRATIAKYRREAAKMRAAVNRHFWDGDWYVRATKDSGEVIGSRRCRDGRIFLNAQTWADPERRGAAAAPAADAEGDGAPPLQRLRPAAARPRLPPRPTRRSAT